MIRATPDSPAHWATPRESHVIRLAVIGAVCALFTSAVVMAQDRKPSPPAVKEAVKNQPANKTAKQGEVTKQAEAARLQAAKVAAKARGIANRERSIQRYMLQGRPIVRGELLLVRTICQLKNEQLRAINRESEEMLGSLTLEMLDQRAKLRQAESNSDASTQLQERLAIIIKRHLSPEQTALYETEIHKRNASRKEAALNFLLDALDQDLVLSSMQREKLRESLSSHWNEGWYVFVEYLLHGNEYYDISLEPHVVPVLNNNQKRIWRGLQKVQGLWGFGANLTVGAAGENDDLFAELGLMDKAQPKPAAPIINGH